LPSNTKPIIKTKPLHFSQKVSPVKLFSLFANQPWSMWLDSCESDHIDSRYDIIVWQPAISLITKGKNTTVEFYGEKHCKEPLVTEEDPFLLLKQIQQEFFNNFDIESNNIPFLTGAVGYCSYDLGRRVEQLPEIATKDIDTPEMAMGIYQHAIIFDNLSQQFSLLCPDSTRESIEKEINALLNNAERHESKAFQLTSPWQANITKEEYKSKFDKIQDYLLSGDCYQINLTQRFTSTYLGDEFHAYLALRASNKAPFSAFIRLKDHAILSISPERFLKLNQQNVQSKPIKGTKVRSDDKHIDAQNAEALANSSKDQAENLMIVDLLRNDMSKVCQPGTVKVPKLFDIESFPAVHHLVSTVEGVLESNHGASDLLRASFPGGSITGAPKIRAMEIIDELEPQRRNIYCGSIGYISACGNMDTNITIRTLICEQNNIHCWAGGGIVADSNVDAEYQESLDKVNKILPILEKL